MPARSHPWSLIAGLILCLPRPSLQAQPDTLISHITLDEFVVSAQAQGFDVATFVRQVMDDTTFYQSFLNTRYHPHHVESGLVVRNKKERETATLYRKGRLVRTGHLAELVLDSVHESGNLRDRRGNMRYLTAEMYDDVFFPRGAFTASNTIRAREQEIVRTSRFEEYKSELKKFMFNPGQEIASVPFVGDRLALFSPEMAPYYDFRIWSDERDGRDCWVFSADTRPGEDRHTAIKEMSTWFDKGSGMVIAREYRLLHTSILLDFDLVIKVRNRIVDGVLVPARVDYSGEWDIPFRRIEIVRFWLDLREWRLAGH